MATRRPKVPRATPAAPKSPDTGGGDVILADFSGRPAPHQADAPGHAATPASGSRNSAPARNGGAAARTGGTAAAANTTSKNTTSAKTTPGNGSTRSNPTTPGGPVTGAGKAAAEPEETPVPAKAFSGRMLALSVVMIAITIMLAPTVKIFFEKRAEIAALEADISAKEDQQNDLKRQVSRWQDPNYVKQQARDRINMVMPGETGYWVFGSDLPAGESSGAAGAATSQDPAKLPWVDTLWESIRRSATD